MLRSALVVLALVVAPAARAADLPTGTWTVNAGSTKGDLVITEVKNTKVKAKLLGTEVVGTWDGEKLTLNQGPFIHEAYLLTEPAEKGKTKYTLAGLSKEVEVSISRKRFGEVSEEKTKGAWYAQITADTPVPTGEIKAEIRGMLVQNGTDVYVSVKRKSGSDVEETRVYVWKSEGEWKLLQHTLAPMYGKEVIVTASIAQMPKGHMTSIPEGALYFLGKFEPKLANAPK
jgi:hypothetical protein